MLTNVMESIKTAERIQTGCRRGSTSLVNCSKVKYFSGGDIGTKSRMKRSEPGKTYGKIILDKPEQVSWK